MERRFRFARTVLCVWLLVMAAVLSALTGCAGKYETMQLTREETAGSEPETAASEETAALSLEDADGIRAAEQAAVADLSALESDVTTSNGFEDRNETVQIAEDRVNLREDCGTQCGIVAQVDQGTSLQRTGYAGEWSRVVYEGRTCYVKSEFLTEAPQSGEEAAGADAAARPAVSNGRIVAIDAGHQAKGNSEKEPIGPGSSTMKAKVASGTQGVSTGLAEYELTLSVSKKLQRILEERGYEVVMIRESNDVNISNAERAEIANESGASVFVRVHANSVESAGVSGTLSMCQTSSNPYNGDLHARSYSLSQKITDAVCAATGFQNRGVQEPDTMSGINWCRIPVCIIEMGFMSNPEEDQKMAQDEYQKLIAGGIANGIDAYFAGN